MATLSSSSSSAFIPTQRHHTSQSATLLFTKPSNFPLLPFPAVSRCRHLRRRRSTPSSSPLAVCAASLKEKIDGLNKTWSNITSLNHWVVREYGRLVNSVNVLEPQIQKLSDEQLSAKTLEFRRRLREGESISHIQAEAFAVVREAAKRKLGMRHFDVQIIGGAVLHDGAIAEMKTGEGKTLVSTLAAYLNALTGEGVHVVTVNDYLAQRDAEWMGRVHRFLGLSVGLIQTRMTADERRLNYGCDITYTNNSELGFDYLRDNLATSREQLVMRWPKPFHFAIVDEVDSVLIDEGRNPLLISGQASKDAARYPVAARLAELLMRDLHYNIEFKDRSVELTEEGIFLAEMALETNDLWDENDPWARFVINALKAKEFYKQDVQYIVRNGKALIINELTGRVEDKRRWSDGIHQAVEAKEGLEIKADSVVVAQITYQSLFKLYPRLSGMTGTAKSEHPSNWCLHKLLRDFTGFAGKILNDSFSEITEEALLDSLVQLHDMGSVTIDDFCIPNLPGKQNPFRGIRGKTASLKRWLAICADDSTKTVVRGRRLARGMNQKGYTAYPFLRPLLSVVLLFLLPLLIV